MTVASHWSMVSLSPRCAVAPSFRAFVLACFSVAGALDAQNNVMHAQTLAAVRLETDATTAALGIDNATPRLTWAVENSARGTMQSSYRVLVATRSDLLVAGKADVWDSKVVPTSDPFVVVRGAKLKSRTRYYWSVQITANGKNSAWAPPTWFETAYLSVLDWKGDWIAGPERSLFLSPAEGAADDSLIRANNEFCRPPAVFSQAGRGGGAVGGGRGGPANNQGECREVRPAPMLRKSFTVSKPVAQARVYTSGIGYNDLQLNGTNASYGKMGPGYTDYDKTVLYTTHDVTSLIKQGENVIASELGSGLFDVEARVSGDWGYEFATWRGTPRLRLDLHVTYTDGTSDVIKSDASWRVSVGGPTRYDSYYLGEVYDARKEIPGWNAPGFDAGKWTAARIVGPPQGIVRAQQNEADRVVAVRSAGTRKEVGRGVFVYTVDQNVTGWARLKVTAPAGTAIEVFYTEKLDSNGLGSVNGNTGCCVRGQLQTDYYIAKGSGVETWTPRFSYKGFQFVQISGPNRSPLPAGVTVLLDSVEVMRADVPFTSTFVSSSGTLNRIHRNTQWAVSSNMHSGILTDTPVYEKNPWTGDAQLSAGTASTLFDTERLYRKQFQDMIDNQTPNGEVSILAPSTKWYGYIGRPAFKPTNNGGASPSWDAFWFVVPWESWERYGDRAALERTYPVMQKYLDEWVPRWTVRDGDGFDYTLNSGLGDWVPPAGVPTLNRLTATAYYAHMAHIAANTARALGKKPDAARYDTLFTRIRKDFNAAFLGTDGTYRELPLPLSPDAPPAGFGGGGGGGRGGNAIPMRTYVHTAQIMALAFGLVPDSLKTSVAQKLADDIVQKNGGNAYVGVLGARYVLPVLTESGHHDAAVTVATQTDEPSWGYWTDALKFTGLGEHWVATTRSQNHHFFGTITQWMYEDLAGMRAIDPGYRTIEFKPGVKGASVDSVSASYESVRGTVATRWKKSSDELELDVTVPPNATGVVYVTAPNANAVREIGSGNSVTASLAPGVKMLNVKDGLVAYTVGSGVYKFRVSIQR